MSTLNLSTSFIGRSILLPSFNNTTSRILANGSGVDGGGGVGRLADAFVLVPAAFAVVPVVLALGFGFVLNTVVGPETVLFFTGRLLAGRPDGSLFAGSSAVGIFSLTVTVGGAEVVSSGSVSGFVLAFATGSAGF